ncbi:hypothetical protein E8E13_001905 [Curvularia kusanoi]|uniref:Uncharacterized protein n=1 Tax=Curvularia kusanoi TaxID=90978 RepID=A0A9P4T7F3_CURKU|nr:hypothetical protein E8E13_001905 [Curvularia kusanoi]
MPRQLPWKSGGGGRTRTVKPPVRPSRLAKIPDDFDGDVLEDAVLAVTDSKGKDKARATPYSDSSLSERSSDVSAPQSKRTMTRGPRERPTSSSPPPIAEYALQHHEPMRKAVSKFDLRDDEWMMVEDEFLETAKLFTRHLHIAEYDRLKATIEAKKKEVKVARPVIAGAERSTTGALKQRAKAQENKQKKAIRDVFAALGDSSEDDGSSSHQRIDKATSIPPKPRPSNKDTVDTDSDDLDTQRPPKVRPAVTAPAPATQSNVQSSPLNIAKPSAHSFARPAPPRTTINPSRTRVSTSRMTPFDMLDEYTPLTFDNKKVTLAESATSRSQSTSSNRSSPRIPQMSPSKTVQTRRSLDLTEDWEGPESSSTISKEVADRIAKRKAQRAKEDASKGEKRATQLDDIPTFLF